MDYFKYPRRLTDKDHVRMMIPQEFRLPLEWKGEVLEEPKSLEEKRLMKWEARTGNVLMRAKTSGEWFVYDGSVKQGVADVSDGEDPQAAAEDYLDRLIIWNKDFREEIGKYIDNLSRAFRIRGGLHIYGPTASGKTAAAAVISKSACRRYRSTAFFNVWELRNNIRSRVMFDAEKTLLWRAREVDLLVLDGLDVDDLDDKFLSIADLEKLVTTRAKQNRITIITTRLSPADMESHIGLSTFYDAVEIYVTPIEAPKSDEIVKIRQSKMRSLLGK